MLATQLIIALVSEWDSIACRRTARPLQIESYSLEDNEVVSTEEPA